MTRLTIPSFSSVSGGVGAGVSSSIRNGVRDELLIGMALKDRLRTPKDCSDVGTESIHSLRKL